MKPDKTKTNAADAMQPADRQHAHGFTVLDQRGDFSARFENLTEARQYAAEIGGLLRTAVETDGGAPMHAPDKGLETALDLITLALPYVEDAESDPAYKKGIVAILTKRMRAMIEAPQMDFTSRALYHLSQLIKAAGHVERTWAAGDLAGAVRNLTSERDDAEALLECIAAVPQIASPLNAHASLVEKIARMSIYADGEGGDGCPRDGEDAMRVLNFLIDAALKLKTQPPQIVENRTGELLALLEQVRPYVEYYHEREGCDFTLSALRSALEKGGN